MARGEYVVFIFLMHLFIMSEAYLFAGQRYCMSQSDVNSFIANSWQDEKRALMQRLLLNDVDDEWLQSDIQKTYSVEFKSDFDQVTKILTLLNSIML
jgi:hypothetical protein